MLPDTKAIKRATVEIGPYRKGYLVRYKNLEGYTMSQRQFKDVDEANGFFWKCVGDMKKEVERRLGGSGFGG